MSADQFPRQDLLVEAGEFPKLAIVLDARPRKDYDATHVPGAVWVDHAAWSKAFGDGDDTEAWSRRIGDLGIDGSQAVVIYDDSSFKDSARIWWIMRYWGVPKVRLLNGGWTAWQAAKLPVDSKPQIPTPVQFKATPQSERLATKGQLLKSLADRSLQIIDARSEAEHCGTDASTNKRSGAIPGAKNLEWTELVEPQTKKFRSPTEMQELFSKAGIDLRKPSAAHCQSGGRAAVMAFGLELMGSENVRNYYRSWSEWGNADDTPVESGKTPAAKPE